MKLSENEKALYAELVVQIAIRMGGVVIDRSPTEDGLARKDRFDIKGRVIEHGFLSDFEAACVVLHKLGILHPLNSDETPHEDENAWTAYYRMKFGVSELRKHLSGVLPDSAPSLSDIVLAFLRLTTDYGCEISTGRDAFAVSPEFERAFDLFEQCGYVERLGGMVEWTDRIAPEMRAIYAWNEDAVPREDLGNSEIVEMRRTMPPSVRKAFFSGGPVDVVSLSVVISRFWYYGKWQDTALDAVDTRITLRGGAIGKARALEKEFRSGH